MTYKVGEIEFINYLPLAKSGAEFPLKATMFRAFPKKLNDACRSGELDITPISFFAYNDFKDTYKLLPTYCIAGDGDIVSVRLFSNFEISQLRGKKIFFTNQSESSIGAFCAVCKFKYGFNPKDFACADISQSDAGFLIGDSALSYKSQFKFDYDLGALWKDAFKTPMVYSAIAVKREIYDDVSARLCEFFKKNLEIFYANRLDICELAVNMLNCKSFGLKEAENYYNRLIFKVSEEQFKKSGDILHGKFA